MKGDQGKQITNGSITPIKEDPERAENEDGELWTIMQKPSRDRGKSIDFVESSNIVQCLNGFGVLGTFNGPQGPYDGGTY